MKLQQYAVTLTARVSRESDFVTKSHELCGYLMPNMRLHTTTTNVFTHNKVYLPSVYLPITKISPVFRDSFVKVYFQPAREKKWNVGA